MEENYVNHLLRNEENLRKALNESQTPEEKQLIALLLIRNNLKKNRVYLENMNGWVKFFGVITVLNLIGGFIIAVIFLF